jgi:hypothetical protein
MTLLMGIYGGSMLAPGRACCVTVDWNGADVCVDERLSFCSGAHAVLSSTPRPRVK